MLLFDDDLQFRQETTALFLQAQAQLGLGRTARGRGCCKPCSSVTQITLSRRICWQAEHDRQGNAIHNEASAPQ